MKGILVLAAAIFLAATSVDSRYTYSGHSVHRCDLKTRDQLDKLRMLEDEEIKGLKFLNEPNGLYSIDFMVSPEKKQEVLSRLTAMKIQCETTMKDVSKQIEVTLGTVTKNNFNSDDVNEYYREFHPYEEMELKLQEFAKNPLVVVNEVGKSYENRSLYLVKISKGFCVHRPTIFLDAGHHAREWGTHSTLFYVMESLINDNMPRINSSSEIKSKPFSSYLDNYNFMFMPAVNPDGYEYSRREDRMWRKTRSPTTEKDCIGVDANRNYDFAWENTKMPCSETYGGKKPFSEPETKILAKILDTEGPRIKLHLSLHTYSQLILLPYNYADKTPENYDDLARVAAAGIAGIKSVRGTTFQAGVSARILYPASGTAEDYSYAHANISIAYGVELPDTGSYNFLMPPEEIIPVGQEMLSGLSKMIDSL